jgi:hypothetical protein
MVLRMAWEQRADREAGSYILYTHMMKQRRKVMRGKGKERAE